jgi:O-antigen/teichoic acid export membrane protein
MMARETGAGEPGGAAAPAPELEQGSGAQLPAPAAGRRSMLKVVGGTGLLKLIVMGVSGVFGLFTSRLIIQHFGIEAYGQYGLLASFPGLLPFADLGIAAVIINAVAGAQDPRTDRDARHAITTAFRILIGAGLVLTGVGLTITLLGLWPTILGDGLTAGGPLAAFLCLAVFGLVLPLTVGQRVLVGLQRTGSQVAAQTVVAPFMFLSVGLVVLLSLPVGDYLAILTYIASSLVSVICLVIAARAISPQIGRAIRDVPRVRSVPNVAVLNLAWPSLVQMIALPIAMQSDRLLLSHVGTPGDLAQYNLASQLFGMILQATAAAGIALWPIYARARADRSVQSPVKPMGVFTLVGLAGGLGLALLSGWIADFISDGAIRLDPWLVAGFVVFVTLQACKYPLGMYMTDKKGLAFQVPPILVLVPLNLGLSWWLIGVVGAGGPIIGSAVSVLVCQVVPNYLYVRRDLRRRSTAG